MAKYSTIGLEGLQDALKDITNIPDGTKANMIQKMGETAVRYQQQSAKAMLSGEDSTGLTASSIVLGKAKLSADGGAAEVTFRGREPTSGTRQL